MLVEKLKMIDVKVCHGLVNSMLRRVRVVYLKLWRIYEVLELVLGND